jgi:hypothetical protein
MAGIIMNTFESRNRTHKNRNRAKITMLVFTKHFIIVASLGGLPQDSYGFLPKPSYSASSLVCFALAVATGATTL